MATLILAGSPRVSLSGAQWLRVGLIFAAVVLYTSAFYLVGLADLVSGPPVGDGPGGMHRGLVRLHDRGPQRWSPTWWGRWCRCRRNGN